MPNTSSAKKAHRASLRKRKFNLLRLSKIKASRRSLNKALALENPDKENVLKLLAQYFSSLDKAVKTNYIHKNKSSRLKSRATKKVNQLFTQAKA
jgi:ribosomal protein S20